MAYYIRIGAGVLVDAGSPGEENRILAALEQSGLQPPGLIFLTHSHFDHFGSAAALQRCTGALVAVHAADADPLRNACTPLGSVRGRGRLSRHLLPLAEWLLRPEPVQPDVLLEDMQRLEEYGVPGVVIHTPGHTNGSSTLLLDTGEAFAGDLISATGCPHVQRYYAQDWDALSASVHRLQGLNPSLVYSGHGSSPVTLRDLQLIS